MNRNMMRHVVKRMKRLDLIHWWNLRYNSHHRRRHHRRRHYVKNPNYPTPNVKRIRNEHVTFAVVYLPIFHSNQWLGRRYRKLNGLIYPPCQNKRHMPYYHFTISCVNGLNWIIRQGGVLGWWGRKMLMTTTTTMTMVDWHPSFPMMARHPGNKTRMKE